jgi:hypothetical protein
MIRSFFDPAKHRIKIIAYQILRCICVPLRAWYRTRALSGNISPRAAVIAPFEGGVGGVERAVFVIAEQLRLSDFVVDVFVQRRLPQSRYSIVTNAEMSVILVDFSLNAPSLAEYAVIYVFPYVTDKFLLRPLLHTKALTIGLGGLPGHIPKINIIVDMLHFESPASASGACRSIIAPHNATISFSETFIGRQTTTAIPQNQFLLTVFNPWGSIKGLDDFLAFATNCVDEIVWCHDDSSTKIFRLIADQSLYNRIANLKNVRILKCPSGEQLKILYQHCSGYVCFSKYEGYGWAIADAIRYRKPICSRRVGVLSYFSDFKETLDFTNPIFDVVNVDIEEFFSNSRIVQLFKSAR